MLDLTLNPTRTPTRAYTPIHTPKPEQSLALGPGKGGKETKTALPSDF
jgi:hypothetical protein